MKILFCNIAWMDYYKGKIACIDEPQNGGSYVVENGIAFEDSNFKGIHLSNESGYPEGNYCLGYVETKSTNGSTVNQLNIEKIDGCDGCKTVESVDGVLVVFCALQPFSETHETCVVGWYKNATVYRHYQTIEVADAVGKANSKTYNIIAKKEDCVLLPVPARHRSLLWKVNRAKGKNSYGIGQSNVWFAQGSEVNEQLSNFLLKIEKQISDYRDDNWIDKYPTV